MNYFKICLISFSILFGSEAIAQEFNTRMNITSCSTFTVQMQCVDATYLPSNGDFIYQMDISFASLDAFSLSVGSSSNGFSIGSPATATSNGYNVVTFAESVFGQISTNFTLNTWYDIAAFTITSGSTNFFLTTTAETPAPAAFANYFTGDSYFLGSELGISNNVGTLAKTWIGGTSTAWSTAANWCPATAPSTGENIIIPNQTNDPILSATTSVGNIEIQSGALLGLNGNQLTATRLTGAGFISGSSSSSLVVNGTLASTLYMDSTTRGTTNMLLNLTVNNAGGLTLGDSTEIIGILTPTAGTITTGGYLTLAATATGVYAQIDASGTGTFSGNIKMEKFLTNTTAGWRQFSLPLVGNLSNFGDMDLLYASHGTANERNAFYWDATDNAGKATGWTAASSTDNQTRGYSIYSSNSTGGLHDFSQTISHTGTYDKTNRSYDIKATEDPANTGASATGWNLIGNPYPSNLDLTAMFTGWPGTVSYKAIHVWDATAGQYKAILGSGATIENYNTAGGTSTSTVLAPFQAFWVKANSDVSFTINNSYRTTSATGLGTFMKGGKDLARLNVLDKNNRWDQAVVYFESAASEGFDPEYDGYKLISMNADVPSLYAINQDGIFSISALDASDYQHSVPLGFRSTTKGEMSFELDLDELDQKWYVYLEDKELGIFYNIKENPYTFNHSHNSDSRFVLHFQTFALSADVVVKDVQKMKVGGDGEAVYVFVPAHYQNQVYNIEVMDFAGRSVYNKTQELNYGMNTLNFNLNNSAYYIFRITAAEGMVSEKVFLR